MITRITSALGERVYDDEIGQFIERRTIPCHRCGVCCERWQAPVTVSDIDALADWLGETAAHVTRQYTVSYPFSDGVRLLRHEEPGCVFLRYESDGRSACAVHPIRPEVCRTWTASLGRRECIEGMRGSTAELPIPLTQLYPEQSERAAFVRVVSGSEASL